jgi:hypothetical protein
LNEPNHEASVETAAAALIKQPTHQNNHTTTHFPSHQKCHLRSLQQQRDGKDNNSAIVL